MNFLNSLSNSIKNVFVGSHKGDDISDKWFNTPHPHDSMPIANGSNRYAPPEKLAELELEVKAMKEAERNPRPEEDIAGWFKDETEPLDIPIEETLHEKVYRMATAKYNPFAVGGSESIHDFEGGSENVQKL